MCEILWKSVYLEIDNLEIQSLIIYVNSNIVHKGLFFWDNNILVFSFATKSRVVYSFLLD